MDKKAILKFGDLWCEKYIDICFQILMVCIAIIKFMYLFEMLPLKLAAVVSGVLAVGFLGLLRYGERFIKGVYELINFITQKVTPPKMMVLLILLSIVSKLIAIVFFDINSLVHPDIDVYITTAEELANSGVAVKFAEYCCSYSHMFWFAVFLTPITYVFGTSHLALSIYLALVSTASEMLIFDTIKYNFSYKKAIVFCCFFIFLPSQIILPAFITHEHALVFFLSLFMWLYFKVLRSLKKCELFKKMIWLLAIINLVIAIQINMAGIIAVIAICIIFIRQGISTQSIRMLYLSVIKCVIVVFLVILGMSAFEKIQLNHSIIREDFVPSNKILWTLYVGANEKTKGTWSIEDVNQFNSYNELSTKEQIKEYQKKLVIQRYKGYLDRPIELLDHMKGKMSTIWACFVYPLSYANETITNPQLQVIYNRYIFKLLVCIEYGVSIILIGVYFVFHSSNRKKIYYSFIKLYMLGITAMLLLTECTSKYTISLQPIFVIACIALNDYEKLRDIKI